MLSALSLAFLGLLLGVRHAVDPDHVVAVTAIATRETSLRRAGSIGALWGVGHTATILLVGGAIILFRVAISPRLGLALEFGVALMLIGLGVANLVQRNERPRHAMRPLLVGMVHGLAGSAAVALLVVATVDDPWWGIAYLTLFGVGTVFGMLLVTTMIALPSAYASAHMGVARRYLTLASGAASLVFGIVLATQIGIADGLFSAAPRWTPH